MPQKKNHKIIFSIVIPTVERVADVGRLLASIVALEFDNLEVIIVDQNKDGRIDDIVARVSNDLLVRHHKVLFLGITKARNYGLQKARGKYVVTADDDATFLPGVLSDVLAEFSANPDCSMVSFRVLDPVTFKNSMMPFPLSDCLIDKSNFYKVTIEFSQCWRVETLRALGGYDERFGLGTCFVSDEGADLIVRALEAGCEMRYLAKPGFTHPAKINAGAGRFYRYASGTGLLFWKHLNKGFIWKFIFLLHIKGFAGMLIFLLIKPGKALCYAARICGFWVGFFRAFIKYSLQDKGER